MGFRWPWQGELGPELKDPQRPPEVYARRGLITGGDDVPAIDDDIPDVPAAATENPPVLLGDKPQELLDMVAGKWERKQRERGLQLVARLEEMGEPIATVSTPADDLLTVPWTRATPTRRGVYFYCSDQDHTLRWCVVDEWGGKLNVQHRLGDARRYTSVASITGLYWAGPVAIPENVMLSELPL